MFTDLNKIKSDIPNYDQSISPFFLPIFNPFNIEYRCIESE